MLALSRQAASSNQLVSGPGVPYATFMGLIWAGACLSALFMSIRLIARWRGPRRFYEDDACAALAAVLVLISAGLWQWAATDIYYVLNLAAGLVALEADFTTRLVRGLKASFIVEFFFYTSLFLVKLSFLLFFRRLSNNVHGKRYIWWSGLVISVICYLVSVGDIQYECLVNTTVDHIMTYCTTDDAIRFTTATLITNCALDVLSDAAIMIIPFTLLWNVRVHMKKKLAFFGLFSLSIVTIAIAVARTADLGATAKSSGQQDSSYLWMWSAIQCSLAVVVSCLCAFPQLFAASVHNKKPQWTPTDTYYQRLKSRMQGKSAKRLDPLYDISAVSVPGWDIEGHTGTSHESHGPVLRPEMGQSRTVVNFSAAETYQPELPQNQIVRQMEFQVTEHSTTGRQQPPQQWRGQWPQQHSLVSESDFDPYLDLSGQWH